MHRNAIFSAIALAVMAMSGCSSAPEMPEGKSEQVEASLSSSQTGITQTKGSTEKAPAAIEAPDTNTETASATPSEDQDVRITALSWITVDVREGKSLERVLMDRGILLSDSEAALTLAEPSDALMGQTVNVIHDGEGRIHSLYGKADSGEFFTSKIEDGVLVLVKAQSPVMEPEIRLPITSRTSTEKLGLTQKLALKRSLQDLPEQERNNILNGENAEISFKALFVQGKMLGPTELLSLSKNDQN